MSPPIRVLIAEDQSVVRAGFQALLDAQSDVDVVGTVATGRAAVAQTRALRPDLVLMDIRMPEMDGLEATRQILGGAPPADARVLILTTFELDEYVFGALRAGASGFLLKGGDPADLLSAIRVVAAGESLLTPSVTRRLIEAYVAQPAEAEPQTPPGLDELTAREHEVLALVAAGLSNGRSPPSSRSARSPPRPTCRASSASSARATVCSSSSSRTRAASRRCCRRADARARRANRSGTAPVRTGGRGFESRPLYEKGAYPRAGASSGRWRSSRRRAPRTTPGCPGARCRWRTRPAAPTAAPRGSGAPGTRTATGLRPRGG